MIYSKGLNTIVHLGELGVVSRTTFTSVCCPEYPVHSSSEAAGVRAAAFRNTTYILPLRVSERGCSSTVSVVGPLTATDGLNLPFPPQNLLAISVCIALSDLRTHVYLYQAHSSIVALYDSGQSPDRF